MRKTPYIADSYTSLAKKTGYRARSVFKLKEIQEKYHLIKKGDFVLDLGSAPGSFLQYMAKIVGNKGFVLGVDLKQIERIEAKNVKTIKKDIYHLKERELLDLLPRKQYFDVLVADLAPKTSGISEVDQAASVELNERVIEVSRTVLKPKGILITKIFQSPEADDFLNQIKKDFKSLKRFKPKASRKKSREIFIILQK